MLAPERMRYMANQRSERLATEFQRALSEILRNDVNDPRVGELCSILRVELSSDLSYCKAFLTVYGSEEEQKEAFLAVQRATPFIKRQLGNRVRMRKLPELKFILDDSIAYSVRIGQLINQLNDEKKS